VSIRYSDEAGQPLETAGGIFRALPLLTPGPFAVVNGDVFTDFPFERCKSRPAPMRTSSSCRIRRSTTEAISASRERLALAQSAEQFTFAGIAVYRSRRFFDGCTAGAFPLKPLLLRSMGVRRCSAELYGGLWEDVGTPERLQALNRR
jgi:N-acetyl-alpha-D-muramate 1-phosphate uridylyltransferase